MIIKTIHSPKKHQGKEREREITRSFSQYKPRVLSPVPVIRGGYMYRI